MWLKEYNFLKDKPEAIKSIFVSCMEFFLGNAKLPVLEH